MICDPKYDLSSRAKRGICILLKIKSIPRQLRSTAGAEIAEAALVLPLVFTLLFGIIWFGRAFNIYSTIQQAAQQGAITAARATCATCGVTSNTFPSVTTVDDAVYAVMNASHLDITKIKLPASPPNCAPGQPCSACPSPPFPPPAASACSSTASIYVCENVQLNPAATPVQCGTVVSFQYPFQFNLPGTSLNMQQVILSAQAQSRMEN
jgi:Flp pilus assembly protein TadG